MKNAALLAGVLSLLVPRMAAAQEDDEDDSALSADEEESDEEADAKQPPVTAGGLYSKANYPEAELKRPLTITKKMTEVRLGAGSDVSAETAFETFYGLLDVRHGLTDNLELAGSLMLRDGYTRGEVSIEGSLVYDVVDFRLGLGMGSVGSGDTKSSFTEFVLGFPFRYAFKPEIGIVALESFITFQTEGKPDLTPAVAIVVQPTAKFAALVRAQTVIVDMDTDAGFTIPATAAAQVTASRLFDIGLEFTFKNIKPPAEEVEGGPKFYDQRELLLYVKARM